MVFYSGEFARIHSGIILVNRQILLTTLVGIAEEDISVFFLVSCRVCPKACVVSAWFIVTDQFLVLLHCKSTEMTADRRRLHWG